MLAAKNPVTGTEIIGNDSPPVVLIDVADERGYQHFETAIQEKLGLFSDKVSSCAMHFISQTPLENAPYLIQSPLFGNFLDRSWKIGPQIVGQHYGRLVASTLQKRAFGLAGLMDPSAKIQLVKLVNSSQKLEAVEAVRNYLLAARFQTRMATVIANAVDELIMNAIFDAPIDDIGRPIYKLTARNSQIKLEGKHAVDMQLGFDGKVVAINISDNFGSLDKANLLTHIARDYSQDEYKIKSTAASAGIGLSTVYKLGGSLFFASESRVRTEVTVMFRKTDNFVEFKDQFRFLSSQFYF